MTSDNIIRESLARSLREMESLKGEGLTPIEMDILLHGFRCGVEAKADQVQPLITALDMQLTTMRPIKHTAGSVVVSVN